MQRSWREDADKCTFIILDRGMPDTEGVRPQVRRGPSQPPAFACCARAPRAGAVAVSSGGPAIAVRLGPRGCWGLPGASAPAPALTRAAGRSHGR